MRSTGLAFLGDVHNLTRKTLYVVPHQDDELFTFGLDVVKTLSRGDSVYVLLVTDGSECWVKDMLADGKNALMVVRTFMTVINMHCQLKILSQVEIKNSLSVVLG